MDRADAALVVPSSATAAQDLILIVAAQYIEQSLMRLEFSARGKLMRAFIHPVSPSNPIGDLARDTSTNRRVRSAKGA
jgi:hypothetical protein